MALPDDLERLGDALTTAAERTIAARRRRRAALAGPLAAIAASAAILLAGVGPADLGRGEQPRGDLLELAAAPGVGYANSTCDQPRGARFTTVPRACEILKPQPQAAR